METLALLIDGASLCGGGGVWGGRVQGAPHSSLLGSRGAFWLPGTEHKKPCHGFVLAVYTQRRLILLISCP